MLDEAVPGDRRGAPIHRNLGDQAKAVRFRGTATCCESMVKGGELAPVTTIRALQEAEAGWTPAPFVAQLTAQPRSPQSELS